MAGLPGALEKLLGDFDDRLRVVENRRNVSRVANSAGDLIIPGQVSAQRLRLAPAADASLTSTGHNLQIGADDTQNMILDNNEIITRLGDGATGATLYINTDGTGGNVTLGTGSNTITIPGLFNNPNLPLMMAVGTFSLTSLAQGASTTQSITFPSGRFTRGPVVLAMSTNSRYTCGASSSTTSTGASITVSNWSTGSGASSNIWWVAFQMSSSNAFG